MPLFHFLRVVKSNSKLITLGCKTVTVHTQLHSHEGLPITHAGFVSLITSEPHLKASLDVALVGPGNKASLDVI